MVANNQQPTLQGLLKAQNQDWVPDSLIFGVWRAANVYPQGGQLQEGFEGAVPEPFH